MKRPELKATFEAIKTCQSPEARAAFSALCKAFYTADKLHILFDSPGMQQNHAAVTCAKASIQEEMKKSLPQELCLHVPRGCEKVGDFFSTLVSQAALNAIQDTLGHDKKAGGLQEQALATAEMMLNILVSQTDQRVLTIPLHKGSLGLEASLERLKNFPTKKAEHARGNGADAAIHFQHQLSVMDELLKASGGITSKNGPVHELLLFAAEVANRAEINLTGPAAEAKQTVGTPLSKAPWVDVSVDSATYLLKETKVRERFGVVNDKYGGGTCIFARVEQNGQLIQALLVKKADGSVAKYPLLGGKDGAVVCNNKICRSLEEIQKNLSEELAMPCNFVKLTGAVYNPEYDVKAKDRDNLASAPESHTILGKAIQDGSIEDLKALLQAGVSPTLEDWAAVDQRFNTALRGLPEEAKSRDMKLGSLQSFALEQYKALLGGAKSLNQIQQGLIETCANHVEVLKEAMKRFPECREMVFLRSVFDSAKESWRTESKCILLEQMLAIDPERVLTTESEAWYSTAINDEFIGFVLENHHKPGFEAFLNRMVEMMVKNENSDESDNFTRVVRDILPLLPAKYLEKAAPLLRLADPETKAKMISSALKDNNIDGAKYLLARVEHAEVEQWFTIASNAAFSGNFALLDCLLDAGLLTRDLGNGNTILHLASSMNDPQVVRYLWAKQMQSEGIMTVDEERKANLSDNEVKELVNRRATALEKFTNKYGETPLGVAADAMRVTLCKEILGDSVIDRLADEVLETPENLASDLTLAFLNSETREVLLLLDSIERKTAGSMAPGVEKAVSDTRKFIQEGGKLIARFPSKQDQTQMHEDYGKAFKNYETQQMTYAQNRFALYSKGLENIGNWSLFQMYQHLSGKKLDEAVPSWRLANNWANSITASYADSPNVRIFDTPMNDRYARFRTIAENVRNEPNDALQLIEKGYIITQRIQNGKIVELTKIDGKRWFHTPNHMLSDALKEASQVYEEIKAYDAKGSSSPPEELKQKIAYFFWLGSQIMPTARSNSQYMLEMHSMLYEMHGYDIGAPSTKWVLPDCVALSMPFDKFYQEYYSQLFDNA